MLRDPRLLILDEATSALDAHTERDILNTLSVVAKGRTTVSITHRLAMAAAADRIYVLKGGRLVEEGTHAELVKAGGLYQRLYEEQTVHAGATETGTGHPAIDTVQLEAIPLFGAVGEEGRALVARQVVLEHYAPGADVVRQGDPGDKLYLINKGEVEVLVAPADGTERRVNTLHEGDYFGEMALLTGEPRTATVRATMPTELYSLSRAAFERLLQENPALRGVVEETVAARRTALAVASSAVGTALPAMAAAPTK